MTVSPAGLERVSVKIRLVVPELPSTTAVSLTSSRGGVCAGALRRARHTSKNKTTRRILRFRAKPGTATIPNTVRIHNGSGRFLQFLSTPSRIPSVMAAVEHAWKRKLRSRRFSRGWLLIFFGESKSSLRGPQNQTTSESKVRGPACRCQRLFAEKENTATEAAKPNNNFIFTTSNARNSVTKAKQLQPKSKAKKTEQIRIFWK